jgi:hypothetical protein
VVEYANKISAGDYKQKAGAKLIKKAEKLNIYFTDAGLRTRHFYPQHYPALLRGEVPNAQPQAVDDDENTVIIENTSEDDD